MSGGGFLERIREANGDGGYAGDQFGGGDGEDGGGLPRGELGQTFVFATGIEGSYPTIGHGKVRRDLMAECGHYDRFKEDFGLVEDMGLRCLRYGLPLHRVWLGPDRYDWDFADAALGELKRLGIHPILDLIHFGLPDWIGDFQNPDLPLLFHDYCAAVAERYPWVRAYTPVNEAFVTARNSARDGLWNEQLKSDRAFVTAVKHLAAAGILGCQAIAERRPDAVIVQSESAEYTHRMSASVDRADQVRDKVMFLALDLLYGHCPDADVLVYAFDNGLTRDEYDWFMRGEPPGFQVLGLDYYGRNERVITPDGRTLPAPNALGWRQIAHEYWRRYRKPLMHTETNDFNVKAAPDWLWKQWVNVLRVRSEGVPVMGFTWYSLTDQVDWDIQLAKKRGRVNRCGLYDLDRKPNPVAHDFRQLLEAFGRISIMPHAEMLAVTGRPARLKVDR
jgi:beta-glucosidase/6-phospho-beta-glucosidase/beta-galactosidase